MPVFFEGWPLWEKLTFCLALAIVLAILLGTCKNLHSLWTVRKYTKAEERLLDPTPHMIESQAALESEVPFGIRALESGIEVEGVWISRSNTPVPSCPGSPSGSIAPSISFSFMDEPPTPSFAVMDIASIRFGATRSCYAPSRRNSESASNVSWSPDNNNIRYIDAYRRRPLSRTKSESASNQTSAWHPDLCSSTDHTLERTLTSLSDDTPQSTHPLPTSFSSINCSEHSRSPEGQLHSLPPKTNEEKSGKSGDTNMRRELVTGADLGLMYSHRLSHVAETGQLIPRFKRSSLPSGDWAYAGLTPREPRSRQHPPISLANRRMTRSAPTSPTMGPTKQPSFLMVQPRPPQPEGSEGKPASLPPKETITPPQASKTGHEEPTQPLVPIDHFFAEQTGVTSTATILPKPEIARVPLTLERHSKLLREVNGGCEILQNGSIAGQHIIEEPKEESGRVKGKRRSRRLSKERPSTEKRNKFC